MINVPEAYLFIENRASLLWFGIYARGRESSLYPPLSAAMILRDLRNEGWQIVYENVPLAEFLPEPEKYRNVNVRDIGFLKSQLPGLEDLFS